MICCLIAALLLGPLGLWAMPRAAAGPDCCVNNQRAIQAVSMIVLAVAALCLTMALLLWLQPAPFRHICSVFQRL
jgi:hypothetical protein